MLSTKNVFFETFHCSKKIHNLVFPWGYTYVLANYCMTSDTAHVTQQRLRPQAKTLVMSQGLYLNIVRVASTINYFVVCSKPVMNSEVTSCVSC